jgi:hypothetical protein
VTHFRIKRVTQLMKVSLRLLHWMQFLQMSSSHDPCSSWIVFASVNLWTLVLLGIIFNIFGNDA